MASDRATCWSLTINNPTQADEEAISLARQKGWKVEGQKERGESGTEHYQLLVRTPQVRFAAVKKQFPRGHIEAARNPVALAQYVAKEDTRVAGLATDQQKYPSLSRFWHLVVEHLDAYNAVDLNYVFNPTYERPNTIWFKEAPREWKRDPLTALDEATSYLIEKGYHVEAIACNPQMRMAWKKFHAAIIIRTYVDRQTDSQRVQNGVDQVAVVNIPTTDADEDTWSRETRGVLEGQHGNDHEEEGSASRSSTSRAEDEGSDQVDR